MASFSVTHTLPSLFVSIVTHKNFPKNVCFRESIAVALPVAGTLNSTFRAAVLDIIIFLRFKIPTFIQFPAKTICEHKNR
jgi:hypothetical protein